MTPTPGSATTPDLDQLQPPPLCKQHECEMWQDGADWLCPECEEEAEEELERSRGEADE